MQDTETRDPAEVEKFSRMAADWWDPEGSAKPLHLLNPCRLDYIREQLVAEYGRDFKSLRPLEGLEILDIGCGGGLVSEPLCRMGAKVTGIDAAGESIPIAAQHAMEQGLEITYRQAAAEDLVTEGLTFDAVVCLEVIEHVSDPAALLKAATSLLKPGAPLIMSTLNRTSKSYGAAILGAEVLLRWLPKGTHDWRRFVTPEELYALMEAAGLEPLDTIGFRFDPLRLSWHLSDSDISVNYAATARRPHL